MRPTSHSGSTTPRLACLMIEEAPTTRRGSQLAIPLLGDRAELVLPAAGGKLWLKPHPGCEVAATLEARDVADRRSHGGSDQRPDAGNAG